MVPASGALHRGTQNVSVLAPQAHCPPAVATCSSRGQQRTPLLRQHPRQGYTENSYKSGISSQIARSRWMFHHKMRRKAGNCRAQPVQVRSARRCPTQKYVPSVPVLNKMSLSSFQNPILKTGLVTVTRYDVQRDRYTGFQFNVSFTGCDPGTRPLSWMSWGWLDKRKRALQSYKYKSLQCVWVDKRPILPTAPIGLQLVDV